MRSIQILATPTIEFELESPCDPEWLFGRFRIVLANHAFGDWSDAVTLRGLAHAWRKFTLDSRARWIPDLEGLDAVQTFTLIGSSVYSDQEGYNSFAQDAADRFHINGLGLSAFDPYIVLLVAPPDSQERLLWQVVAEPDYVYEALIPAGSLRRAGKAFLDELERACHTQCPPVELWPPERAPTREFKP